MTNADVVIAGAGCSGLSLAVHLVEAGVTRRRILLIEPRESYASDRTWCFWRMGPHPFESCVSREWRSWLVRAGDHEVVRGSRAHPYQRIDSRTFYDFALERLRRAPNVELVAGCRVRALRALGSAVEVVTDQGAVRAPLVFDSRPPGSEAGSGGELMQHFLGLEVRMEEPVFDREVATLMDFEPPTADGIQFTYVLPSSPRTALVEATFLSPRPFEAEVYRSAIRGYLRRCFGAEPAAADREERGVLPMTRRPWPRSASRRIIRIGTGAGAVRASTGYAFLAIQRFAAEMARRMRRSALPSPPRVYRPRAELMDRIFLTHLLRDLTRGPEVFTRLFSRAPAGSVVRFLSDRGSWLDDLRIVAALPKLHFSAAVLALLRQRWTSA